MQRAPMSHEKDGKDKFQKERSQPALENLSEAKEIVSQFQNPFLRPCHATQILPYDYITFNRVPLMLCIHMIFIPGCASQSDFFLRILTQKVQGVCVFEIWCQRICTCKQENSFYFMLLQGIHYQSWINWRERAVGESQYQYSIQKLNFS